MKSLHAYPVEVLRKIYSAIIRSNNYVDINSLNGDELLNENVLNEDNIDDIINKLSE